jgi:pimeloyl-ACP methyl ester carboxylesterase
VNPSVHSGSTVLRDGRRLGHLAIGPADGLLVIYLHGAIGSPQQSWPDLAAVVERLGVRYVMVSRPGFGDSDPQPGRTLTGFAGDVAQLADALGRERFAVIGVSAGGPYALACAHELGERVVVAGVVSCMSPSCRPAAGMPAAVRIGLRALRARPRTCARAGDALLGIARRHPRLVTRVMRAGAPPADRRELDCAERSEAAAGRFLAAARSGVGGMIEDFGLCTSPWGFDPAAIARPVQLWHGMQDAIVSADDALGLAAVLPHVMTALDPDEGHFFYGRRLPEILGDLARAARAGGTEGPRRARGRDAGPELTPGRLSRARSSAAA